MAVTDVKTPNSLKALPMSNLFKFDIFLVGAFRFGCMFLFIYLIEFSC